VNQGLKKKEMSLKLFI